MMKKILALCVSGAFAFGSFAMAAPPGGPGGAPGGGGAVSCTDVCAPSITLPDGTFCVLDGCLIAGESAFCNYSCFFGLPF